MVMLVEEFMTLIGRHLGRAAVLMPLVALKALAVDDVFEVVTPSVVEFVPKRVALLWNTSTLVKVISLESSIMAPPAPPFALHRGLRP